MFKRCKCLFLCFFKMLNLVCIFLYVPVANKWIHEHGQEFQHRCSLNPEEWEGWSDSWAPFLEYKSQPLQLRGTLAGGEKEGARKWAHRQGRRKPLWGSLRLWLEPRAPGSLKHTVLEWTRTRGGVEEDWGSWQSAPRGQTLSCSYWPVPADGERPLPSHTVLVSLNCAGLFASLLKNWHVAAHTGPTQGFVITNQHWCTLRTQRHLTCLNHSTQCLSWCTKQLEFSMLCNVAAKNKMLFLFECSNEFKCDYASMKCWNKQTQSIVVPVLGL